MENKTKYRIIGAVAVVGLVIALLPLFQDSRTVTLDSTTAPPFPDQPIQVEATNTQTLTTSANANLPSGTGTAAVKTAGQRNEMSEEPDDTIHAQTQVVKKQNEPAIVPNEQDSKQLVKPKSKPLQNPIEGQKKASISHAPASNHSASTNSSDTNDLRTRKSLIAAKIKSANENDEVFKISNKVWVIQIGSFKNKVNALRLVNQLRSNGYRAFIQQVATNNGHNTRVFVGPENKQQSAMKLASQLENEMHIRGIVITYQPLEL